MGVVRGVVRLLSWDLLRDVLLLCDVQFLLQMYSDNHSWQYSSGVCSIYCTCTHAYCVRTESMTKHCMETILIDRLIEFGLKCVVRSCVLLHVIVQVQWSGASLLQWRPENDNHVFMDTLQCSFPCLCGLLVQIIGVVMETSSCQFLYYYAYYHYNMCIWLQHMWRDLNCTAVYIMYYVLLCACNVWEFLRCAFYSR